MVTDREMLRTAESIRREAGIANPQYNIPISRIRFRIWTMSNCAGKAFPGTNLVKLSRAFFADRQNFETDFCDTVLHEIAHIVARKQYPDLKISVHGPEWKQIARELGAKPERCHSMRLAQGFKARSRSIHVAIPCFVCGELLYLRAGRARVYQEGINAGRMGPGTGYGFGHYNCMHP